MQKGDVILIVFPFTDLSGNKLRPALGYTSAAILNEADARLKKYLQLQ